MCGIAGILGPSANSSIGPMVRAMHHRGPNDNGLYSDGNLALGMARLSVLDVSSAGHQPMQNSSGTVVIVYNGEVYNFNEEKSLLIEKGHVFSSQSDTEVILRMYEIYGEDFLLRLRGMFALAIYDNRQGNGRLLLARDHLGIKPLLYSESKQNFLFSSELKSILASGLIDKNIEPEALRTLLTFGSVVQPYTMIKDVFMLLPGHKLIIEDGKRRIEKYWELGVDRYAAELSKMDYPEMVSFVKGSIEESVREQMISDVPLGAFLSGGLDSSFLVSLMAQNSSKKINTFSVGFEFEGASIDESEDAQKIAKFIGTEHSKVVVTGRQVKDHIFHIASALDQPSVDGVNSYFVSLAARQAVTVAISGTGGDEIFAGYPWFISMVRGVQEDLLSPLKTKFRGFASRIARMPALDFLISTEKFGPRLESWRGAYGFLPRYSRIFQIFGACGAARILSNEMKLQSATGRELSCDLEIEDILKNADSLDRVSGLCLRGYAQNQLLRDIDAVSMAHSLEVRVPFLSPAVVDLALSLPDSAKLGNLKGVPNPELASYRDTGTKKILVDAAIDLLPKGMDQQPKRGFAMPFDSWLRGPLREVMLDALSRGSVAKRGFFDADEVSKLIEDFNRGSIGWAQPWLLMMIELWCRQLLDVNFE